MNELRRTAYLEAMGIDAYVSRRQLPGAAVTRRLALATQHPVAPLARNAPPVSPSQILHEGKTPRAAPRAPVKTETAEVGTPGAPQVARFSLSAIVAGQWLWLEELGEVPLTVEQVQLVGAMARALLRTQATSTPPAVTADKPEVAQFDWPIHTNRQLALDEEAAGAAVAGFINRRLEQFGCRGLVMLGKACSGRVAAGEFGMPVVQTASTADMLGQPSLKAQVWRDLQSLPRAP